MSVFFWRNYIEVISVGERGDRVVTEVVVKIRVFSKKIKKGIEAEDKNK